MKISHVALRGRGSLVVIVLGMEVVKAIGAPLDLLCRSTQSALTMSRRDWWRMSTGTTLAAVR